MTVNDFKMDGPSAIRTWPIDGWLPRTPLSHRGRSGQNLILDDDPYGLLMGRNPDILYRIMDSNDQIINIGETERMLKDRMPEKFRSPEFSEYARENDLFVQIIAPIDGRVARKEGEAVHIQNYIHQFGVKPRFNAKHESPRIKPSEWSSGLRSLARDFESIFDTDIGIRNTTPGTIETPNDEWIRLEEKVAYAADEDFSKIQVLLDDKSYIYAFSDTEVMWFTNKWRKSKNVKEGRVPLFRLYFSEEMNIGVRQGDETYGWEVNHDSTQRFFNRIVELSLRTKWK